MDNENRLLFGRRKERMMGIYIPNMDKPKNCWECPFYDSEYPWTCDLFDAYCPLIDIVTCGECKYAKYKIEDAEYEKCMITQLFVGKSDFCSYGERRTETLDERIKRGLEEWKEK